MDDLMGHVEFFEGPKDKGKFKGYVRRSPNEFKDPKGGQFILEKMLAAQKNPVIRPVDKVKLARKPLFKAETRKGKKAVETLVSIPDAEPATDLFTPDPALDTSQDTGHTAIQHLLLSLGADMGFDVWVARNDRGKSYKDTILGNLPGIVTNLPMQFNEATNRTIELIDVLWLKGNSIVAAFEVECTTAIYSGLLRMSDLLALQPNLNIDLYIVAPEERKAKVEQEILRPTFMLREKPLAVVCGFLPISALTEKVEGVRNLGLTTCLKPDFLEQVAEYFGDAEE